MICMNVQAPLMASQGLLILWRHSTTVTWSNFSFPVPAFLSSFPCCEFLPSEFQLTCKLLRQHQHISHFRVAASKSSFVVWLLALLAILSACYLFRVKFQHPDAPDARLFLMKSNRSLKDLSAQQVEQVRNVLVKTLHEKACGRNTIEYENVVANIARLSVCCPSNPTHQLPPTKYPQPHYTRIHTQALTPQWNSTHNLV